MLTLEERERRAYIEGRTEEAELLSQAVDADALDELQNQLDDKTREANNASDEIGQLETKVENLEKELEQSADRVEELEQAIHDSGVDLVV